MRVQSDRPSANGGWLHLRDGAKPVYVPPVRQQEYELSTESLNSRLTAWKSETTIDRLFLYSEFLGVDWKALDDLGACYSNLHQAWAFPMRNGFGALVGIRFRGRDGAKWSQRGGKEGLFISHTPYQSRVYVCEGPTDTAAALSIGLFAVGRPSCSGAVNHLQTALGRWCAREVVIIGDNDEAKARPDGTWWYPGQEGAQRLQQQLSCRSCVYLPPTKDLREFVRLGGTADMIQTGVENLCWNNPMQQVA